MKLQWLLPVFLVAAVALAGCMGGGGDDQKDTEYVTFTDGMQLMGQQEGLAQASPVELYLNVPINLDFEKVIMLQINITVEDGDADTEADQVGTMELRAGGSEDVVASVNGGNTPVSQQLTLEWEESTMSYLNSTWELHIPVTINGGGDQWPGPFIWRGIPDRGFSYTLDITYEYHDVALE